MEGNNQCTNVNSSTQITIPKADYDMLKNQIDRLERELKIVKEDRDNAKYGTMCLLGSCYEIIKTDGISSDIINMIHDSIKDALNHYANN